MIELICGLGRVGAYDDESAIGVWLEVLHLPRGEGRAGDNASKGLGKGGAGADDEAAVTFEESEGEDI